MDTLSKLSPIAFQSIDCNQKSEAVERLHYLAERGRCGLLTGPSGSGKTLLLQQLATELRREGHLVGHINMVSIEAAELPYLLISEFGLGIEANVSDRQLWSPLEDYVEAHRHLSRKQVVIFDHLDKASPTNARPLERLLSLCEGSISCLFAARPKLAKPLRSIFKHRTGLRIETGRSTRQQIEQQFAQELAHSQSTALMTEDAIATAETLTKGHREQLRHLAELTILAAEAEGLDVINTDFLEAIQKELSLR